MVAWAKVFGLNRACLRVRGKGEQLVPRRFSRWVIESDPKIAVIVRQGYFPRAAFNSALSSPIS